jgi:demethylmenaquinone methyltransferase/2-methoxy-6-polyprenyl-1,4-benzoquinol methylase
LSLQIREMFDSIAGRYDFLNHFLSAGRDAAWRKMAVRMLPSDFSGMAVDVCGGTGDFFKEIKKQFPDSNGIIADFSREMLAAGATKSSEALLVQADALSLPFYNERFDCCVNGFGMRNLDDLSRGIVEAWRVVKPGGYFITLEFFKPQNPFTRAFYGFFAPMLIPLFGALFSGKKEAYEYLVRSIQNFSSVEEYKSLCSQVGWDVVESKACDFGIAHAVCLRKPEVGNTSEIGEHNH